MNNSRAALAAILIAFASVAAAQQFKWTDKNGKTQYGDNPPPGVKATAMRPPPGPATQPPAGNSPDAKGAAAKGPLTPAEQDQAFRKRQEDAKKAAEKSEKEAKADSDRKDNCARAQEAVRTYEAGGRISKLAPNGERIFLSDDERIVELTKARKAASDACKS